MGRGRQTSLGLAYKAATKDIIHAYSFGEAEKYLDMEDMGAPFFGALAPSRPSYTGVYFPWVVQFLAQLNPSLVVKMIPKVALVVNLKNVGHDS